jgi:LmbE family N-acetylglucosaminyl deacetylase
MFFSALVLFILLYDKEPETSVFYSPHADDEILSLGPSILRQIDKGNEVAVVLLSHGEASNSFLETNNTLKEKGFPMITREEFGESRIKEFKMSVEALGVKAANIHVYDLPDGKFTKKEIMNVMTEMDEKYPDARHHSLSYRDPHHDHALSGEGLRQLVDERKIESALYYLPVQEFENIDYDGSYVVPKKLNDHFFDSLDAYNVWKPEDGFYSIGYTSVTSYFSAAKKFGESRWHW